MNFDKKKVIKIVFLTFLTSFVPVTFLCFAWYLGFFNSVVIGEVQSPLIKALILPHQGNYQKVGRKIIAVQNYLASEKIECKPIIIYYNDEAKVIKKHLRSGGGCIFEKLPSNVPKEYEVIQFNAKKALSAHILAHPVVAKIKLFLAIREYATNKNIPLKFPVIGLFEDTYCLLYLFI